MQRSKAYRAAEEMIDRDAVYAPLDAVRLAKETAHTKYDSTVEVAMRLGVDPRKADQMVRGTVNLPHGTGKTARVLVFATGANADAATAAGADYVGSDDLLAKVQGGWLDFDAVVATPDLMGKVGRLGKVLGPRGLMPNPKVGTVTPNVAEAVKNAKAGQVQYRADKAGIVQCTIGRASFPVEALAANFEALIGAINKSKPASSKGVYLKKVSVSCTMGVGIRVDHSTLAGSNAGSAQ